MIYLDSNATTQVHPEVLDAMLPFLKEQWHNPSSSYVAAKQVRRAIETAREQLATLINAKPQEIIFTGCGTEANNSVLSFLAGEASTKKKKILTSQIEHSAVLRFLDATEKKHGHLVEKIPVDSECRLDLSAYEATIKSGNFIMASIMWANNETGVIQPIELACELAHEAGLAFHTDAIQAVGKTPIDLKHTPVDYLSISGHKLHAPKGVGALFIREGLRFEPLLYGGNQENGRRSGTENVAGIVALGKAAELMKKRLDEDKLEELAQLRDHLEKRLVLELEGVVLNGSREYRLGNTSHLSIERCDATGLLILLDEYGVQCSAGSACMTGKTKPSHVQVAMGISSERAKTSLRISFSIFNTKKEADTAVDLIKKAVKKLRSVQGGSGIGPVEIHTQT